MIVKLTASERRADKVQDYERQDEVAARAANATVSLIEVTQKIVDKVDVVHTLTNSAYTAALTATLESTKRELILLQHAERQTPSIHAHAAIEATTASIEAQESVLAERHKTDAEAQAQIAAQAQVAKAALDSAATAGKALNGIKTEASPPTMP